MTELIGMSADVKGRNFTLDSEELTIGRASDNTCPINNATVSGHHCKIFREGDFFKLQDLGSTNGTRVNGKDVQTVTLRPKDLIQVGSVEFLFNSDAPPPEESVEANSETEVVVSQEAVVAPTSFASISPFGARRRENPGLWLVGLSLMGLVTLGSVGYLVYTLVTVR